MFISPDTLVPDPALLIDYNRFAFVRGNPLKYTDPTGHCVELEGSSDGLCLRTTRGKVSGVVRGGTVFRNYTEVGIANLYYGNENAINVLPKPGGALNAFNYTLYDVHEEMNGRSSPLVYLTALAGMAQIHAGGAAADFLKPRTYVGNTSTEYLPNSVRNDIIGDPGETGTVVNSGSPCSSTGCNTGPLGRGSTGRNQPADLKEQLALEAVLANPSAGRQLRRIIMSDPRWPAEDGWIKMAQNHNGIEIHYTYNRNTGAFDDLKFK